MIGAGGRTAFRAVGGGEGVAAAVDGVATDGAERAGAARRPPAAASASVLTSLRLSRFGLLLGPSPLLLRVGEDGCANWPALEKILNMAVVSSVV